MNQELSAYWHSEVSKSWSCIPGRICGGAGFMRQARYELEALTAERDRLHAALKTLAVLPSSSELSAVTICYLMAEIACKALAGHDTEEK